MGNLQHWDTDEDHNDCVMQWRFSMYDTPIGL